MIQVVEINDINKLPATSVQYSASDPVTILEAYKRKYKRTPDRILHYVSPLGNWNFYSIPHEVEG